MALGWGPVGDLGSTQPAEGPANRAGRGLPGRQDAVPEGEPAEAPPSSVESLTIALTGGSADARAEAVAAAGSAPDVEPLLIRVALGDPDPAVRRNAVRALGSETSLARTRAIARAAAMDPSPDVRSEAIAAVAKILRGRVGSESSDRSGGRPA